MLLSASSSVLRRPQSADLTLAAAAKYPCRHGCLACCPRK
ncbi:hypothetical protein HMPREF1548_05069 [Clostridium sp. KLE 1755]|nr:hypothetical protein HMPREF1548_05069 [Clostridium sp. KLE 1755]